MAGITQNTQVPYFQKFEKKRKAKKGLAKFLNVIRQFATKQM